MDYQELKNGIKKLQKIKSLCVKTIGKSVFGNNIYAVECIKHNDFPWVIITAGIHGREHLSCDLVIKQIYDFIKLKNVAFNVAFVPLVNPDGANISKNQLVGLSKKQSMQVLKICNKDNLKMFKANANGVDLNNNFDANWQVQHSKTNCPSSQGFYGTKPFDQPESLALKNFTEQIKPFLTISYHLKGEEIYFDFFQSKKDYSRDKQIAEVFAQSTGYSIKSTQAVSSGGYKDWCVQKLKIPALTIELGSNNLVHPVQKTELDSIYSKNKAVFDCIKQTLEIYKMEK